MLLIGTSWFLLDVLFCLSNQSGVSRDVPQANQALRKASLRFPQSILAFYGGPVEQICGAKEAMSTAAWGASISHLQTFSANDFDEKSCS